MKTLALNTRTLLSTAILALFLGGVQPAIADGDMPHVKKEMTKDHEHTLSQNSENDPLFEKLPEGNSGDTHEIGNSENGPQNEKLPVGNNKDGHHDVEKDKK